MRVLFDTNVVLDVLLEREPHVEVASRLFALVDSGRVEGYICATTATTVYYIAARGLGQRRSHDLLRRLLSLFDVAVVDGGVLGRALNLDFADYEDAVAHEAACAAGASAIVTRNVPDFSNATLPVLEPLELLAAVAAVSE